MHLIRKHGKLRPLGCMQKPNMTGRSALPFPTIKKVHKQKILKVGVISLLDMRVSRYWVGRYLKGNRITIMRNLLHAEHICSCFGSMGYKLNPESQHLIDEIRKA